RPNGSPRTCTCPSKPSGRRWTTTTPTASGSTPKLPRPAADCARTACCATSSYGEPLPEAVGRTLLRQVGDVFEEPEEQVVVDGDLVAELQWGVAAADAPAVRDEAALHVEALRGAVVLRYADHEARDGSAAGDLLFGARQHLVPNAPPAVLVADLDVLDE